VTEEALTRDEGILVDAARTMKFAEFAGVVDYWEQLADQDGTDEAAEAKRARRDVYLYPSPNGYLGEMRFDVISGAIVAKEHKRLEEELFEADWAEAKSASGVTPTSTTWPAPRPSAEPTPWSRWRSARPAPPPAPGARAPLQRARRLPDALWAYLPTRAGPVVAPGSLLSWLDTATFERIVFAPDKRAECSETSRFFTGATRRAVEVRDLQCQHEFCDRPAEECQIDHIVPFSQGGLTEQGNAQVLCGPTTGCDTSGPAGRVGLRKQ